VKPSASRIIKTHERQSKNRKVLRKMAADFLWSNVTMSTTTAAATAE